MIFYFETQFLTRKKKYI